MRPIPVLLVLAFLAGCSGGNGYVVSRDGRLVAETPAVASEEFAHRLAARAADAAGRGWQATAVIREEPVMHLVRADEYGWKTLSVDVVLVPPTGAATDAGAPVRAEVAVREAARWRVARAEDVRVSISRREVSAPLPGSQTYTTVGGDTWAGISTAFFGSAQHWRRIADANPGVDGASLPAGTVLTIPPRP